MWQYFADSAQPPAPSSPSPKPQPPAEAEQPVEQELEEEGDREDFAAAMLDVLPWAVSLLLHAGLVLLAVFMVWSTIKELNEEEPIVPMAKLSANPGAMRVTQKTEVQQSAQARRSISKTNVNTPTTAERIETTEPEIGRRGGSAGLNNPFGVNIGDVGDVGAKFYGTGGNAYNLAYLVDASGSLIDSLPFVISELNRSIAELSPQQRFTVLFFQDGDRQGYIELPPAGLKPASEQTRARAREWMATTSHNVVPKGRADPVPALQRALSYRPELVFLLSDNITGRAQYEVDQDKLVRAVRDANSAARAKINTIQFLYRDPLEEAGRKATLERIADESGGMYKFVSQSDLNLR